MGLGTIGSSCCYLLRALDLLRQLFPTSSTPCTIASKEAISNMLECPCSHDGYLLAIMSLVVFEVVDNGGQGFMKSNSLGSPSLHSEQVRQCPTVLVLSELNRVQRLVNQLSEKLKTKALQDGGMDTPNSAAGGQIALFNNELTSPFSTVMLDQLGTDLRKRLCGLSLEIVEMLRPLRVIGSHSHDMFRRWALRETKFNFHAYFTTISHT
ncbi:uncharacterized protein BDR25DRAFT_357527 [Lindgomyces ingoldianus]|uniref:Uncharacterized protein n=1 Tax=Lindgomyces ingoldianus TaxID=673940 RepID=A0ACB6QP02_9PLEO|nr:uncharacterized protein BDR25DRAFT_357527 [Lindgomyces ingoldianus]KAF2468602.1 hypothetical protein BDR25DRAFT_357527 [Lindgomyces ingoldianus]